MTLTPVEEAAKVAVSFYLPADLVAATRIAAIRARVRPTRIVEAALRRHLDMQVASTGKDKAKRRPS
jgi:hypothetical protein